MKEIIYITGNKLKVDYLKSVLSSEEFNIIQKHIDCPEIQSDNIEDVAKFSAKFASDILASDVLKNDSGLVIPSLNGFPSAYSKYVEQTIGAEGILRLMKGEKNRQAYYLDAYAYCKHGQEPKLFVAKSYGTISQKLSGIKGNGYDKIFIPQGKDITMANMEYEEFLTCFDDSAVHKLAEYLKE